MYLAPSQESSSSGRAHESLGEAGGAWQPPEIRALCCLPRPGSRPPPGYSNSLSGPYKELQAVGHQGREGSAWDMGFGLPLSLSVWDPLFFPC